MAKMPVLLVSPVPDKLRFGNLEIGEYFSGSIEGQPATSLWRKVSVNQAINLMTPDHDDMVPVAILSGMVVFRIEEIAITVEKPSPAPNGRVWK